MTTLTLTTSLLILTLVGSCAYQKQDDRIPEIEVPADSVLISNSFGDLLRKTHPDLKYHYDSISQIHNYSDNWDFDHDGIRDELYFVGTGGAHLYYYLRVILSSDAVVRDMHLAESDFPVLTATDTIDFDRTSAGFVVAAPGFDANPSIIVRLDDQSYFANREVLKHHGIRTKNIVISFVNGKTVIRSLE
ncbi:MAG TPA: hypothetical protein P5228_01080 [Bacteroidales bacterium]|nr:hypothetical protein [Bacteroidales bacterium]HRZ49292.1 hypothetical protein [Bacteroidales bacterium]